MCGKPFGKRLDQSAQLLSDQIVSTVQSNSKTNISVLMPTSSMVKDETVYDLVLFTTEDGVSEKKLRKLQLFRDMSELYYSHFHFRAIVFTNTIQLHQFFRNTSILTLSNFKYITPFLPFMSRTNPYGLPTITSMFSLAKQSIHSHYYGYHNSDILLQSTIFDVLQFCQQQVTLGTLSPSVSFVNSISP